MIEPYFALVLEDSVAVGGAVAVVISLSGVVAKLYTDNKALQEQVKELAGANTREMVEALHSNATAMDRLTDALKAVVSGDA